MKVHPGINLRETINRCLKFSLGDVYDIIINKPGILLVYVTMTYGYDMLHAIQREIKRLDKHCGGGVLTWRLELQR